MNERPRNLKIEATGDFYRGKIKPFIRLHGYWLAKAGFKPGHRVLVCQQQPGEMVLRFVEDVTVTQPSTNTV